MRHSFSFLFPVMPFSSTPISHLTLLQFVRLLVIIIMDLLFGILGNTKRLREETGDVKFPGIPSLVFGGK